MGEALRGEGEKIGDRREMGDVRCVFVCVRVCVLYVVCCMLCGLWFVAYVAYVYCCVCVCRRGGGESRGGRVGGVG